MKPAPQFIIGDRVAFAPAFLASIHAGPRDGMRKQRGFVTHVSDFGPVFADRAIVQVQWDDGHVSKSLNVNLVHREK